MKKRILRLSTPAGLLIYAVYQIINRFTPVSDSIAIPMMLVSIACMLLGVAYSGWCFGKGKNPLK